MHHAVIPLLRGIHVACMPWSTGAAPWSSCRVTIPREVIDTLVGERITLFCRQPYHFYRGC